jgi:toxin ParE1/3/4
MKKLRWTELSRNQLRAIHDHIARDSEFNARRFVARLKSKVQNLRRFWFNGSMIERYQREDLREIYFGNYRISYQIFDDRIEVISVINGARRFPEVPDDEND